LSTATSFSPRLLYPTPTFPLSDHDRGDAPLGDLSHQRRTEHESLATARTRAKPIQEQIDNLSYQARCVPRHGTLAERSSLATLGKRIQKLRRILHRLRRHAGLREATAARRKHRGHRGAQRAPDALVSPLGHPITRDQWGTYFLAHERETHGAADATMHQDFEAFIARLNRRHPDHAIDDATTELFTPLRVTTAIESAPPFKAAGSDGVVGEAIRCAPLEVRGEIRRIFTERFRVACSATSMPFDRDTWSSHRSTLTSKRLNPQPPKDYREIVIMNFLKEDLPTSGYFGYFAIHPRPRLRRRRRLQEGEGEQHSVVLQPDY